jgi:hypothetical protein
MPSLIPPSVKNRLFSTLDDFVEAALDGNTFRTGIILNHISSSFPAIASSCSAAEEHRIRAALKLHAPHDVTACHLALTSLGFGTAAAASASAEKRPELFGGEGRKGKRRRQESCKPSLVEQNKVKARRPGAAVATDGSGLSLSSPAAGKCAPATAAPSASALPSEPLRRHVFISSIFKKLSSFSSRAVLSMPTLRLADARSAATAIESSLYKTFIATKSDLDGYKRQLLRLLNALECPKELDDGLFVARVLSGAVALDDIASMSASDMVSLSAAALAQARREHELHMSSLAPEAVELGKVTNTHVHSFWSYPKDGD